MKHNSLKRFSFTFVILLLLQEVRLESIALQKRSLKGDKTEAKERSAENQPHHRSKRKSK